MVILSGMTTVIEKLQLMGDLVWTHWSRFDEIDASFSPPIPIAGGLASIPSLNIAEDFRDTWRGSLGFNYQGGEMWSVRMGGAFDQSPVTNNKRTVRIPDSNRWFASIGGTFNVSEDFAIDLAYMYVLLEDGTVNETQEGPTNVNVNVQGEYTNGSAQLLSLQLTYSFDHLFGLGS
jgi:long-chain fatty acid transport protein